MDREVRCICHLFGYRTVCTSNTPYFFDCILTACIHEQFYIFPMVSFCDPACIHVQSIHFCLKWRGLPFTQSARDYVNLSYHFYSKRSTILPNLAEQPFYTLSPHPFQIQMRTHEIHGIECKTTWPALFSAYHCIQTFRMLYTSYFSFVLDRRAAYDPTNRKDIHGKHVHLCKGKLKL